MTLLLKDIIQNTNAGLKSREAAAKMIMENDYFQGLLDLLLENDLEANEETKVFYILEIISRTEAKLFSGSIDQFLSLAERLQDSSQRRCAAKIIGFIIDQDTNHISEENKLKIITISFDWLINDGKLAVQVFSMQNIFDLHDTKPWITAELKAILQKEMGTASAGFISRAKKLLTKLP